MARAEGEVNRVVAAQSIALGNPGRLFHQQFIEVYTEQAVPVVYQARDDSAVVRGGQVAGPPAPTQRCPRLDHGNPRGGDQSRPNGRLANGRRARLLDV